MRSPRRGEIYRLQADRADKPRPVLVVSPVHLNGGIYLSAVPFYSSQVEKRRTLKTCVFFAKGEFGLEKDCVAKADEVSMYRISELRVREGATGTVDDQRMKDVSDALCVALGISLPQLSDGERGT